MAQNWQDPAFAGQWDARHLAGNPARAEHLAILLSMMEEVPQGWVLDLGCGSGLVTQLVLDRSGGARIFGVGSAAAMLGLVHSLLASYGPLTRLAGGGLTSLDRDEPPSCGG